MKLLKKIIPAILTLCFIASFSLTAFANELEYEIPNADVTVTLPEGTYIFGPDVSTLDKSWRDAGIENPSEYTELYTNLNVLAHFSSGNGKLNVLVSKTESDTTKTYYSFAELSESDLKTLIDSYASEGEDSYVKSSITYVGDIPFAVLDIYADMIDGTFLYERAIFTIINGQTISFGIHGENEFSKEELDYLDSIVNTAKFTNIIPKSEVEVDFTQLIFILVLVVVLIAGVVLFFVKIMLSSKKNSKKNKELADRISSYRRFLKETDQIERKLIFRNSTILTDKLVKNYSFYQSYIKRGVSTFVSIIITLCSCFLAYYFKIEWWLLLIFVACLIFCIYQIAIMSSKMEKSLKKVHSKFLSKKALYKFYENDFCVSGIQYLEYYPYFQITEFKEYKDAFYLYFGENNCLFVSKNGFTVAEEDDFKAFIIRKMK